jgi:hypothetical protein
MTDECAFCKIVAGIMPARIVKRWDDATAFTPQHAAAAAVTAAQDAASAQATP